MFTDEEIDFIKSQRPVRLATMAADLQPGAAALGFEFDGRIIPNRTVHVEAER